MEVLGKFVIQYYPHLIGAIIVGLVVWQAALIYFRFKRTEEDCKKIESEISPALKSMSKSIDSISSDFKSLVVFLGGKHGDMKQELFISRSPVQLTDFGSEILVNSGGKKFIDDNVDSLVKKIEIENLKSALDVENFARVLLVKESQTDGFTTIKNYMFQHPTYKSGDFSANLDIPTISNIMGIYLRDKYFDRHPELKTAAG